jgi:hypothetical protein
MLANISLSCLTPYGKEIMGMIIVDFNWIHLAQDGDQKLGPESIVHCNKHSHSIK